MKMHLVSILVNGRTHTAFVRFPDNKPIVTQSTVYRIIGGVPIIGTTVGVG